MGHFQVQGLGKEGITPGFCLELDLEGTLGVPPSWGYSCLEGYVPREKTVPTKCAQRPGQLEVKSESGILFSEPSARQARPSHRAGNPVSLSVVNLHAPSSGLSCRAGPLLVGIWHHWGESSLRTLLLLQWLLFLVIFHHHIQSIGHSC